MANVGCYFLDPANVTSRNAEYTGTPFTDTGAGTFADPYLGCNVAGSCAPGIGIATDQTDLDGVQWTLLDQDGAARNPQDSQVIGGAGFVDRSSVAWPGSGGVEGVGTVPINAFDPADMNDTLSLTSLATGWVQNEVA